MLICLKGINATFILINILKNKLVNCPLFQRDFPCEFCQTSELTTGFHPETADTHRAQLTPTSSTTQPQQGAPVPSTTSLFSLHTIIQTPILYAYFKAASKS